MLKHFRQHWCYGNRSVICNRRGRRTFRIWVDIGLSSESKEIIQAKNLLKQYTETGHENINNYLQKKIGNKSNGSVPPKESKSNKRCLTSHDLKALVEKLGDEYKVSSRSMDSLESFLLKWSDCRSALPTRSLLISRGASIVGASSWWMNRKILGQPTLDAGQIAQHFPLCSDHWGLRKCTLHGYFFSTPCNVRWATPDFSTIITILSSTKICGVPRSRWSQVCRRAHPDISLWHWDKATTSGLGQSNNNYIKWAKQRTRP